MAIPALNPFSWFQDSLTISDISQTSIIPIAQLLKPNSIAQLKDIIISTPGPISIAGGRYSQGGHIAYPP